MARSRAAQRDLHRRDLAHSRRQPDRIPPEGRRRLSAGPHPSRWHHRDELLALHTRGGASNGSTEAVDLLTEKSGAAVWLPRSPTIAIDSCSPAASHGRSFPHADFQALNQPSPCMRADQRFLNRPPCRWVAQSRTQTMRPPRRIEPALSYARSPNKSSNSATASSYAATATTRSSRSVAAFKSSPAD